MQFSVTKSRVLYVFYLFALFLVSGNAQIWQNNTACLKITSCDTCFKHGCGFCFANEYDKSLKNYCFNGDPNSISACPAGRDYVVSHNDILRTGTCEDDPESRRRYAAGLLIGAIVVLVAGYPFVFWVFYMVTYRMGAAFAANNKTTGCSCCRCGVFFCSCLCGYMCPITPLPPQGHDHNKDQSLSLFYIEKKKYGFPGDDGTIHSSLWHYLCNHDVYLSIFLCDSTNPVQSLPRVSMYATLVVYRILFTLAFAELGSSVGALFGRAVCTTIVVTVIDMLQMELATCSLARKYFPSWAPRLEDISLRALSLFLTGGAFMILIIGATTSDVDGRKVAYFVQSTFWISFIISEVMAYLYPYFGILCNFYLLQSWKKGFYCIFPTPKGFHSESTTLWRYTSSIAKPFGIGETTWLEDRAEVEAELAKEIELVAGNSTAHVKYAWLRHKHADMAVWEDRDPEAVVGTVVAVSE